MTCGRLVGRLKDVLEGEDGEITLPIPSYLIEAAFAGRDSLEWVGSGHWPEKPLRPVAVLSGL